MPDGHTPTEAEFLTAVRGYARFLRAAAEVIHDPHCFPSAKIITFGMAHGSDRWDKPAHHFSQPARMIAALRNLDGFNYLDNALYHVDGYGTHIYPNPDTLEQSVSDLVRQDAAILGPDKPFWITEWGLATKRYPNRQGQTRSQAFKNFYDTLDKLHVPFGPPFYYAHSPGGSSLIDANGALLPEAKALALRTNQQSPAAAAGKVIVGVNAWFRPPELSEEGMIQQLAENGVKTIRIGLLPGLIDFIAQAYRHGIGTVAIVFPHTGSKAKPKHSWSDVPLSEVNPEEFTAAFGPMLDQLEAAGVRLTAFELGNEINESRFNGDIADPGSGRLLGLADFANPNDAEAVPIAAGFRNYGKIAAALKELRGHSKLNQSTPIVAAGIANVGKQGSKAWGGKLSVRLPDTIKFLRQNGLDKFVDGYAVHVYPGLDPSRSVATRIASLGQDIFSECRADKPCWLTEYGIPNASQKGQPDHCPIDETKRLKVFEELRGAFAYFAGQGRLAAIIYYDWSDKPGTEAGIFRCGALTEAGKLALKPM